MALVSRSWPPFSIVLSFDCCLIEAVTAACLLRLISFHATTESNPLAAGFRTFSHSRAPSREEGLWHLRMSASVRYIVSLPRRWPRSFDIRILLVRVLAAIEATAISPTTSGDPDATAADFRPLLDIIYAINKHCRRDFDFLFCHV
jgi:hypothetical protein